MKKYLLCTHTRAHIRKILYCFFVAYGAKESCPPVNEQLKSLDDDMSDLQNSWSYAIVLLLV